VSRRYRELFEHAPDGLLSTDAEGKIQDANRSAARLLRVLRREMIGRPLALFVSPEQRSSFHARLAKFRAGPFEIKEWHVRLVPRGGEPVETAVAITSVRDFPGGRPRLLCAVRDITRRMRIERRLKERERQYHALYRQMLSHRDALRVLSMRYLHAREEEAQRIAHQLHDEAGQITASIHLALAEIGRELPAPGRKRLKEAVAYLDEIEDRLRRLSHELRPTILDDLGLKPALEFLAEGFAARTGIATRVEGSTRGRLNPLVETAIYRIVQEALANIGRHSAAGAASIHLERQPGGLCCAIRDDGVGFDASRILRGEAGRGSLGLLGVRERLDALGGRMRIRSSPGSGTELSVTVPLEGRA
jgi:two-component system sensor histidine kinase UhpB